jgi:hypothetical protein
MPKKAEGLPDQTGAGSAAGKGKRLASEDELPLKLKGGRWDEPVASYDEVKRRVGRPPKPKDELKARNMTFRVRERLRERLQQAAQENGRSVSEEIEYRVESTFKERDTLVRAFGGLDAETIISPILFFLATLRSRQINWRGDSDVADAMRQAICFIAEAVFSVGTVPKDRQQEFLDAFAVRSASGRIVSCAVMTVQALGLGEQFGASAGGQRGDSES